MEIKIGTFTFSNAYCKLLKYSITGTDYRIVTVSGSTVTYKTDIVEPRELRFNLRVHAQGDRINGRYHYKDFSTYIRLQGCDNEANVITNPKESAWKQTVLNETPNRGWTNVAIREFTYSNPYCKRFKYTVVGEDAALT